MPPRWRETPIHDSGFSPDLPPQTPGVIADSANLYPTPAGVATLPIGVLQIPPEDAAIQTVGTFAGFGFDGAWRLLKGTREHIFHAASPFTTWAEFDNGQTYTMPADRYWSWCMQGNDVYAGNGTDALQKSTAGGQFQALVATIGTVPKGLFNVIVQPGGQGWFLMILGLNTNGTGWAASGVNNDTDWGFDVATLGSTGFLAQTPGSITGAAALRGGVLATKESSFYYGTFSGPPFVWNFVLVSAQIGSVAPLSLVSLGDAVAFLGPDDFYLFDGYSPREIPNNLKRWFFATANRMALNTVQGRYDAVRDIVVWHFPLDGSTVITDWIAWSRKTNRWTKGKLPVWMVYPYVVPRSATVSDTVPAYIDTNGALYHYPPNPAGEDTVATLTTWDLGYDDDAMLAVTRAKLHWKKRPTGNKSLTSIVKQFPGTDGTAGVAVPAADPQDYLDLVQAARWQNLTFMFAGDGETDSIGIESEYAGVQ